MPDRPTPTPPSTPVSVAAARVLKAAARTRRELVERLVRAGHDRTASDRTAQEFFDKGLIDERAIAGAAVRAGLRAGKSNAEIARSLAARGVDEHTIRAALADEPGADDAQRAVQAARDLAKRARLLAPAPRLRRVLAGLARRGYDEDTALHAAREVLGRDAGGDPAE